MRVFECNKCGNKWQESDKTWLVECICGELITEFKEEKTTSFDKMTLLFKGDWPGENIRKGNKNEDT